MNLNNGDNKWTIQWYHLFMPQSMLGVMGELCTVLVPSMHCSMKLLIVTIVEIHTLILDVCECLNDAVVLKVLRIRCF